MPTEDPLFVHIMAAATGNGPPASVDVISRSPNADSGFIFAVNFAHIPPSIAELIGKLKLEIAKYEIKDLGGEDL